MDTKHIADLLNPKEAAKILRCDPASIRRWVKVGLLPGYKIGTRVYVAVEDVEAMCQRAEPEEGARPLTKRELAAEAAETDRILREAGIRR